MAVTYRQPTFKNPLPLIFNGVAKTFKGIGAAFIASCEASGRARAAHELANMGYIDEAKAVMLGKSIEEVKDV